MSGKLLMFAKRYLESFIYDLVETFSFLQKKIVDLNKKYQTVEFFHILTDTEGPALKFIFISDPNSDFPEGIFRDITSEVIVMSKIYKKLDNSHN